MKKFFFLVFAVCFLPSLASAHTPRFTEVDQNEITVIQTPEVSQAFYGEVKNSPHMYEIVATEELPLYVHITVPDIESGKTNVSGIILRVLDRGVEEVTRMSSQNAQWDTFYEWFVGDTYRSGPEFEKKLPVGTYQIEVSSPDNIGKYVLVVGKKEEFSILGYFGTVRDIFKIKKFFEKPFIAVLQSPLISIPLVALLLVGWFGYGKYKKRIKEKGTA